MLACSLGLVGLGFWVRNKVRVGIRDMVGVRVSAFYFYHTCSLQKHASLKARILPTTVLHHSVPHPVPVVK